MKQFLFPFSAIVGQKAQKTTLLLNAVDPSIGGVLIQGHKGTGKSTAARALAQLLPDIEVADQNKGETEMQRIAGMMQASYLATSDFSPSSILKALQARE